MTVKQARKEAEKKLSPINAGKSVPYSTLTLQEFVDQFFLPLAFPILKSSTRKRYRSTLDLHLLPALGKCRLCDIRTVEVQRFVLQKFDSGLGWETCNHLRNLLSKIFANAKKWGHFAGDESSLRSGTSRKTPGAGKARAHAGAGCPIAGGPAGTDSHHGSLSSLDRVTGGRNPRLALARCGPGPRRIAGGTGRLSGLPRFSEDQREAGAQSPCPKP